MSATPEARGTAAACPLAGPTPLFGDLSARPRLPMADRAAAAPVLGARREVTYRNLACVSVLNRCASARMPFEWTINPYRGCEFGCTYCYARYTHEYLGLAGRLDFEKQIYVKAGAPLRLESEARAGRLAGRRIAIGTATDPYQPAERRYGVTRGILEVLAKQSGVSLSITTKSDLVERDRDLLVALARRNRLHVNFSITTLWPRLARLLEPRAAVPLKRLLAMRRLSEAGVECGVFLMPILPGLTDDASNLESVAAAAAEYGARYLLGQALFLRDSARSSFLPFLQRRYPGLLRAYRRAYAHGSRVQPAYRARLEERLRRLRARHGLAAGPSPDRPSPPAPAQVRLPAAGCGVEGAVAASSAQVGPRAGAGASGASPDPLQPPLPW